MNMNEIQLETCKQKGSVERAASSQRNIHTANCSLKSVHLPSFPSLVCHFFFYHTLRFFFKDRPVGPLRNFEKQCSSESFVLPKLPIQSYITYKYFFFLREDEHSQIISSPSKPRRTTGDLTHALCNPPFFFALICQIIFFNIKRSR